MSKGTVWNKGKHNGGADRVKRYATDKNQKSVEDVTPEKIDFDNPINSVKPMKRDNAVVRPVRVVQKDDNK
ncbi:hypothetical protein [Paenibacillus antarcticus]|uniref:Uncharacterized protein n=1 Tax=Paenibacillus antarcticus TaxID=253703 RepID=A0A162LVB0_9BACL|nr:hypothetical protein [Paenibacillus antarcticus]OAB40287.1 hypothetical protein PBAT_23565 [Paenibacillus antarcticus]